MLLNIIKSTGQFHTTATFLAPNVNRAQVENTGVDCRGPKTLIQGVRI